MNMIVNNLLVWEKELSVSEQLREKRRQHPFADEFEFEATFTDVEKFDGRSSMVVPLRDAEVRTSPRTAVSEKPVPECSCC